VASLAGIKGKVVSNYHYLSLEKFVTIILRAFNVTGRIAWTDATCKEHREDSIMREYKNTEAKEIYRIVCNGCGKTIEVKHGIPAEEVFQVQKEWGYLSGKDGEVDQFDLCEECYDRITSEFKIPLKKTEITEYV